MKTLKFLSPVFLVSLLACFCSVNAQTFQKELHATINNEYVACLNKQLSGEWTYHISYHINKKTGIVENVHWNIKHAELWDSEGNKYLCIDTGNDNLGIFWVVFNYINAYNEGYNVDYDNVEDGWLDDYLPEVLPEEGHLVSAAFKFIGNGEVVNWTILMIVHMNANGELTTEIYREYMDCN
jgi:hypothetical protein